MSLRKTYRNFVRVFLVLGIVAASAALAETIEVKAFAESSAPRFEARKAHLPEDLVCELILTGDFGGQKRDSILCVQPKGASAVFSSGEADRWISELWTGIESLTKTFRTAVSDFNRDGRDDILTFEEKSKSWNLFLAGPERSFKRQRIIIDSEKLAPFQFVAGDFEGDGHRDDIFIRSDKPADYQDMSLQFIETYLTQGDLQFHGAYGQGSRPGLLLLASASIDSKGPDRALLGDSKNGRIVSRRVDRLLQANEWSQFPARQSWVPSTLGDFNGDGLTDVLAYGGRNWGWWIANGEGEFAVERSTMGITHPAQGEEFVALDTDGDGSDELLVFQAGSRSIEIYSVSTIRPLHDVRIQVDANAAVRTAEDGRAELAGALGQRVVARVDSTAVRDGYEITRIIKGKQRSLRFIFPERLFGTPQASNGAGFSNRFPGPYTCNGYNLRESIPFERWGMVSGLCPEHSAVFAFDDPGNSAKSGDTVPFSALCCRLPSHDMLTGKISYHSTSCPQGMIVTGGRNAVELSSGAKRYELRCAEINSKLYSLGSAIPGDYWGMGASVRSQENNIPRTAVPEAVRAGIGRVDYEKWDPDSCIGRDMNAVLTTVAPDSCSNFRFSRFLKRRGDGRLEPVRMFPDCAGPLDSTDPHGKCTVK